MKSPPELWAELSEVESLAQHLGEFGEITITRVQPETTVAWEGACARGTVELEPTGWGTKVTITAQIPEPEAAPVGESESVRVPPERVPDPEPEIAQAPEAEATPEAEPPPGPFDPEPDPFDPQPQASEPVPATAALASPAPRPAPKRRGFFSKWLFREPRTHTPHVAEAGVTPRAAELETRLPAPEPCAPEPRVAEPEPEPPAPEPRSQPAIKPAQPFREAAADFEFDFDVRRESAGGQAGEQEDPAPAVVEPERAREVLEAVLENLGRAHHRPFSRG